MELEAGQVAVVTGAASGIGRATARLLGRRGARLVLCDVDGPKLQMMARELSDGECWVITSHAWDAAGARRAGLRSVWLSNREKRWNSVMPHPDLQASGFDEAMETLLCYSGAGSHAAVQHA